MTSFAQDSASSPSHEYKLGDLEAPLSGGFRRPFCPGDNCIRDLSTCTCVKGAAVGTFLVVWGWI